jgi:hypothetical protein
MKLDPSESISNMGTLRVDILDAANLPSADRNGKSDPFCVFKLDGREVHKTKVQKKTLHPAWNEAFETKVASRTAADFEVEIMDWDLGSKVRKARSSLESNTNFFLQADFLAMTPIDLTAIEPFKPQNFIYKLKGKKGEEGKFGELRLRMVFKPDYVTRSRQGSSTFHGTFATPGKIVTGVAGAPLKVGGFAVGGISKGASFLKKNTFGRAKSNTISEDPVILEPEDDPASTPSIPPALQPGMRPASSGSAMRSDTSGDERLERFATPSRPSTTQGPHLNTPPHHRSRSTSSQRSVPGVIGSGPESGTATVRLIGATGFPPGANVQIRIRSVDKNKDLLKSKSIKSSSGEIQYDESFSIQCFADQQFKVFAKDNHLFKDEELGEGLFVVDDTGSGQDTVVNVGEGKVTLRTGFKSAETASNASPKAKRKGLLKK